MGSAIDVQTLILAQLVPGPSYGLKIIEKLETKTKGKVKLSQGAVYQALRELEMGGLIATYETEEKFPERGGRPRRYWKITAEGRRVAMEHRSTIADLFNLLPAKVRALIGARLPEVQ